MPAFRGYVPALKGGEFYFSRITIDKRSPDVLETE
jgi:hypothetical protein